MKKKINYIRKICSRFQAKLLLAFLLCTLLPLLVIGGISYSVSYNISEQRILNASIFSDDQLNLQINERLSHVESVADSMQYDMYTLMQAEEPMECLSALTDTRNNLSLFKSTFDLYYASIFLPSGHLGADEGLYFFPLDDLKKYSIPASALTNPGASSIWFLQKNVSVPFSISGSNKSSDCMACCRILKDTETKRIRYAYILFLDIKEFSGYLEESFADKNIASYILTDQGELVAHNSPDKISCPDKELLESLKKESGTVFYKNKINYHCVRLQNGWYHITEIPDSYIQENVRVLIQSILLTLLFSLPLTILIILFISKKLTFQKMQLSLKENMQSILNFSLTEEKLKYQLLQSQINPHFLYNILGSIQTCQSIGKLDIADQMLTNLTRFYRMTLRKSGDLISIKDELEIARLYLEIEKLCHNDNLSWEFNLEDGIENFLICKFTLQPFLENSILHGISQRTPRIHLKIAAAYGDDTVIIIIEDNGVGIGEKQLEELRHTLDSKIVNYEKHFGIGNVNKRISSPHFGNGHISIESRLYHGTRITIEFDQMEDENEESNDC